MTTTEQIITLLVAERDRLTRAIEALQGPIKQRGRPRKNPLLALVSAAVSSTGGNAGSTKRTGRSAAQRQAQAEKMRAYWAKRRKETGKSA